MIKLQIPSPIQMVNMPILRAQRIRLFVKRDDLLHPEIAGNKWRKLKYNIQEAKTQHHSLLVTFGGAYSNHIAATAAVGKYFDFKTIGIIRGERINPLNPTLSFAERSGMELYFVDRNTYRNVNRKRLATQICSSPFYYISEGGTNALALKGCQEIVQETKAQLSVPIDYYAVACGTGGTIAGMIQAAEPETTVIGFSALKGDFMSREVEKLLTPEIHQNWIIQNEYHFGGYAKTKPELIHFINAFREKTGILLEPIYTGKAMFGLLQLIEKGAIKSNTSIVFIHTGGLQGIEGFNEKNLLKIKTE